MCTSSHACQLICASLACFFTSWCHLQLTAASKWDSCFHEHARMSVLSELNRVHACQRTGGLTAFSGIRKDQHRCVLGTEHCWAKQHSPYQLPSEDGIHWSNTLAPKVKAKNRRKEHRERSNGFPRVARQLPSSLITAAGCCNYMHIFFSNRCPSSLPQTAMSSCIKHFSR